MDFYRDSLSMQQQKNDREEAARFEQGKQPPDLDPVPPDGQAPEDEKESGDWEGGKKK